MAGIKNNIKALFSNTRTRVIIIFTMVVLLITVSIGIIKFTSIISASNEGLSDLSNAPTAIRSIPGKQDQTAQYAALQQAQNVSQARNAAQSGKSAIPTIISTQGFGQGVQEIGPKNGEGGVGFTTLARENNAGPQQSLWVQSLKNSNCSQSTVSSIVSQGGALTDLKAACTCVQLKDDGYKYQDLKPVCTCQELKAAGFNARQMKDAGSTAEELRSCGFDACELRAAGFSAQEMKDGGYSDGELKGAGFAENEIARTAGLPDGITAEDLRKAGCQVDALVRLKKAGVTASAIRRISGCSATQLKAAGFSAADLKNAGFSAADLLKAGFTPAELKQAGYTARDLLDAGLTSADITGAGYTAAELKDAEAKLLTGVTPEGVKDAGCNPEVIKRERLAGISAASIHKYAGCGAKDLNASGFTADDLANAGFTPSEIAANLPIVGDDVIKVAGCDPEQLKSLFSKGVSAQRIHELNGCSIAALKDAGFNAQQLSDAGFTPQQLLAVGFIKSELAALKPSEESIIKAAGCDPQKLHALFLQNISTKRIHDLNGCSAETLKAAGFSAEQLSDAGFTPQELLSVGFTPGQISGSKSNEDALIKAAGCDPQKLHSLFLQNISAKRIHELNGCSAEVLKAPGFNAQQLSDAGFTPEQLLAAGFAKSELSELNPAEDALIKDAGCDPQKLHSLFLQKISAKRIHDLNGCSAAALKAAGFSPEQLFSAGFIPQELLSAGFTPAQLSALKANEDVLIKAAGCDPQKLHVLFSQNISAKRIHELNGCSAEVLKAPGFNAQQLSDAGFTPEQLLAAGFAKSELSELNPAEDALIKDAGCDPQKLHSLFLQKISAKRIHDLNGCSAEALKAAGFSPDQLSSAGFTPQELLSAGFTPAQLSALKANEDALIKAAGCDPQKLHVLFSQNISAKRIHELNGCSAEVLKAPGFNAQQLSDAGFTPEQLLAAGFAKSELSELNPAEDALIKDAGCDPQKLHSLFLQKISAKRIHDLNGCSAEALKAAGFSTDQLSDAGFTPFELSAIKANEDALIKTVGCDPQKLHALFLQNISAKRIHELNGCSAEALKAPGFSAKDLADAGFTPQELLAAGFSPQQLIQAGLSPVGVIAAGRTANCSVDSLKAAHILGVSAAEIKQTLGCNAKQMRDAGYSAKELRAAGFTAAELKDIGFTTADLKAAGFGAKEQKAAGFSAQQLKDAGFNAVELNDAGFTATELKIVGFTPQQLKAIGYSAKDLKNAGFTPEELRKAGYTARDLKDAGFSSSQLKTTGFSAQELQEAGFSPNDTALAGLEAIAPRSPASTVAPLPSLNGGTPSNNLASAEAANAKQLEAILKRQKTQMADQQFQQKIQQRAASMMSAANETLKDWRTTPVQSYIGTTEPKTKEGQSAGGPDGQLLSPQSNGGPASPATPPFIKAGDVLFAVLDTSVNSDEPGPILATIVSGKLNGSKLIGSFTLPTNSDKMVINFNTMSVPGAPKTTSINAYAIDPNTARTALSTRANHHYLLRYGSLFASTFIEGFGNAFQSANTTVTIGGVGGATNTTIANGVGRTTLDNAVIGLATLGKAWGQVAQQQWSTPTTVELCSGTGIGVLFTQDLASL